MNQKIEVEAGFLFFAIIVVAVMVTTVFHMSSAASYYRGRLDEREAIKRYMPAHDEDAR